MKAWICETISNFFGPIQGPARLYAYVKKSGYDVEFRDFNQEAYFKVLSKNYLGDALSQLEHSTESIVRSRYVRKSVGSLLLSNSNNALQQLISQGIITNSTFANAIKHFSPIRNILVKLVGRKLDSSNICYALLGNKDFILSEIEKANRALYEDFFRLPPDVFLDHFQTLLCGKAIIDTVYYPSQLDFSFGFSGLTYGLRTLDICNSVEDARFNFMLPYYHKEVIPLIEKDQPKIIGISITHSSEFVPVFTLASLIRKHFPDVHICLGGATLTEIAFRIQKNPSLFPFFDSLILGPGENSFCELIEHIEKGKNLSKVPNLIYRNGDTLHKSVSHHEFDIKEACCPEYVSVRPGSPIPLETANTCYWGKCIFCYYPRMGLSDVTKQHSKRFRTLDLVYNDIEILNERHNPLYISFTDSAIAPERLEQIANHCSSQKNRVKFAAFVRFEKEFKSLSFCQSLAEKGFLGGQVGLESGSQDTNNMINKGVHVHDAEIILRNFYKAGILIHVYSIVGIPGESEEQTLETYKFIKRLSRFITLDWQVYCFYLLEKGPLAERAAEFDIEPIPLPDDFLSQVMSYDVESGLTFNDSLRLSIDYHEKLKHLQHSLSNTFDIESNKAFLFAQYAKGIDISTLRKSN